MGRCMTTGDGLGHRWGRNSEFGVVVGPVTSLARLLAYWLIVC